MLREVVNTHIKPRIIPFSYTTTASTATMNIGEGDFTVARTGQGAVTLTAREPLSRTGFVYVTSGPSAGAGSYVRWNGAASSKSSWDLNQLTASGSGTEGTVDGFVFGFESSDLTNYKVQRVASSRVRTRCIWGKITGSTGAVAVGGKGFTCTKSTTGTYVITFTPGFGTTPVVMAQGISTSAVVNCNFTSKSANGVTITTAPQTATATDADFYLLVIGQDSRSDAGKNRSPLLNNQRKPRIIAGEVTNTGGTYSITVGGATGGTDFTNLTDNGTGDFSVTIASPFKREPALFAATTSIRVMATYTTDVMRFVARNAAGSTQDITGQTYIFAIGSDDVSEY